MCVCVCVGETMQQQPLYYMLWRCGRMEWNGMECTYLLPPCRENSTGARQPGFIRRWLVGCATDTMERSLKAKRSRHPIETGSLILAETLVSMRTTSTTTTASQRRFSTTIFLCFPNLTCNLDNESSHQVY